MCTCMLFSIWNAYLIPYVHVDPMPHVLLGQFTERVQGFAPFRMGGTRKFMVYNGESNEHAGFIGYHILGKPQMKPLYTETQWKLSIYRCAQHGQSTMI